MSVNPSTKNGFFKVANELAEILAKTSLSGSEVRVLWVVLRKTWGWVKGNRRKDFDKISLSQFVVITGMKQVNVFRALKSLVAYKLLLKTEQGYGINQDYSMWKVEKRPQRIAKKKNSSLQASSKIGSSQNEQTSSLLTTESCSQLTTNSSSLLTTYKRKERKERNNIQKKSKKPKVFLQGSEWNDLIDPFEKVNPLYKKFYSNKTERYALQELVDELGFEKIKWLVDNLKKAVSKPYAPKITKPTELRRDLGKLILFWEQEKNKAKEKGSSSDKVASIKNNK